MDWVVEHFAPGAVAFSLMSQYLPWGRAAEFPALNRRLRPSEVRSAEDYMDALGLEGFTQGAEAAQSEYIPPLISRGILNGRSRAESRPFIPNGPCPPAEAAPRPWVPR